MSAKLVKVNLPKSGMGIEEGTVLRWLKAIGDPVQKGEILVEVETAKAVQEVVSPATGTIAQLLIAVGDTAPVNSTLALIDECDG